jgi:transcriptional regulator with XRE-family HTH domain
MTFVLADRVRRYRQAAGLTQAQLARRLEVEQSTVSAWENGRKTPTIANVARIAAVLDVSIDDLVGGVAAA